MARPLLALFAACLLTIQAGQLSHAAPSTTEVFWRTVMPDSPSPEAILQLLHPDTNFLNKASSAGKSQPREATAGHIGGRDFEYKDYKRAPASVGELAPFSYSYKGKSQRLVTSTREPAGPIGYSYIGSSQRLSTMAGEPAPFSYSYKDSGQRLRTSAGEPVPFSYSYKGLSQRLATSSDKATKARGNKAATTTVFFHEEAVRVGESLPFYFPPAVTAELGFLPRPIADSIPFSTSALPEILVLFGIAPGSVKAASVKATIRICEMQPIAGESRFCTTSLEALVEAAMATVGTHDAKPVVSTLPKAGAPLQLYTVRAVRPVEGSSFVACHDEAYPYTVYRCHTTGPARAYLVDMEGADGGAVTVATVCHTDTSQWNPEHVSFKLLGTKPGGTPVCHLMPYGHIIWAKNVKRSSA